MHERVTAEMVHGAGADDVGRVVVFMGQRYLLTAYDASTDQYRISADPGPYRSLVMWRPICSCGYSGTLGTPDRWQACEMSYQHYLHEHIMSIPAGVMQTEAIPYVCDAEPYWHS